MDGWVDGWMDGWMACQGASNQLAVIAKLINKHLGQKSLVKCCLCSLLIPLELTDQ